MKIEVLGGVERGEGRRGGETTATGVWGAMRARTVPGSKSAADASESASRPCSAQALTNAGSSSRCITHKSLERPGERDAGAGAGPAARTARGGPKCPG